MIGNWLSFLKKRRGKKFFSACFQDASGTTYRVRRMRERDLDRVLMIEEKNFGESAWSKEAFLHEINLNDYARYYVLEREGVGVIGYVGGWLVMDELHVTNLSISPKYQGRGLGRALALIFIYFSKLERLDLKLALLEVDTRNGRAISLYESIGFQKVGLRKDYYGPGKDAFLMALELKGPLGSSLSEGYLKEILKVKGIESLKILREDEEGKTLKSFTTHGKGGMRDGAVDNNGCGDWSRGHERTQPQPSNNP